jgi:hypothetical protein
MCGVSEMMREDNIDDEDYQVREIYAQFGLALYKAQVLEQGLISTIMMARLASKEFLTVSEYDAAWDAQFEVTMGRLLKRLRPFIRDDGALESDLASALSERNRLAHAFFRDHARDFMDEAGRERMLGECFEAQALFDSCDQRLAPVFARFLAASGIDVEKHQDRVAEYMRAATSGASGE